MEGLFVGNSVILLFWVFISFTIEALDKYKKIVLMYLVTYIANVLNVVPTIQSYIILMVALFLELELTDDKFKKQIVNCFFDKLMDYLYLMITQYSLFAFSLSLLVSSDKVISFFDRNMLIIFRLISIVLLYLSCKNTASEKYKVHTFDEIKRKIDNIKTYREFLNCKLEIKEPFCVLCIEDKRYFSRGDKYTFLNLFYLKKILKRLTYIFKKIVNSSHKKTYIKRFRRGYSTIEMQLLRTLAVREGYGYTYRRKAYEIIYAHVFLKNLKLYYEKCGCDTQRFKDYLLYLYLRLAPCLNRGEEKRVTKVLGERTNIEKYSREELFVLTLCFSGKVKRNDVLEIYESNIKEQGLDRARLYKYVKLLND